MCRGEGAASAKGLRQVLPSQACAGDQGVSVRLETGGAGCLLADVGAKAGERHLTWSTWSYTGCVGCSRSSLLCAGSGRGEQGLLVAVASPVVAHGYRCPGFSTCNMPAPWFRLAVSGRTDFSRCGSRALEHRPTRGIGNRNLGALWYVGSSLSRDRTHGPCFGRRTSVHCTTGEAPDRLLRGIAGPEWRMG